MPMRVIEVLDGGLFTTVQDLGRVGYQRYGVAVSGAMDRFAIRAGNRLVGNGDGAAGLELTMMGPELRFGETMTIAVTGADLGPILDGRPAPMWRAVAVRAGAVLSFAGPRDGLRAYLTVRGGINVPPVLGSRSTSTRSTLGGFEGRTLRAGDVLRVATAQGGRTAAARPMPQTAIPVYGHDHAVRVVLGPQDDAFSDAGIETFQSVGYTMTPQSDRIGCRFQGAPVTHRISADIVSDGTTMGMVQVSGDGMPIVLMADCGTTGGYTKIATVVTADLSKLAQAAPGDRVHFHRIDLESAVGLLREQEEILDAITAPAETRPAGPSEDVYDEDAGGPLAGGAYEDLADALEGTGLEREQ